MVWYNRHQPTVRGPAVFFHNNRDKVAREDSVNNVKKTTKPKYQMIIRVVKTNNEVRKYLKCKKKIYEKNPPSDYVKRK